MNGAWITAYGDTFFTDNVFNHEYQINTYKLNRFFSDEIQFNDAEKNKFLDKDVRYKAFKSGLIRIVTFKNQFAIEAILETLTIKSINAIYDYINMHINIENFQDFVVEDPSNNQTLFFSKYLDFKQQFLDKIYNNLR